MSLAALVCRQTEVGEVAVLQTLPVQAGPQCLHQIQPVIQESSVLGSVPAEIELFFLLELFSAKTEVSNSTTEVNSETPPVPSNTQHVLNKALEPLVEAAANIRRRSSVQ